MEEKTFTDNTTGKLIVGTITAAYATATGANIVDVSSLGNAVEILATGETTRPFKIAHIKTVIIEGNFTGTPQVFLWLKKGNTGVVIFRGGLNANMNEFHEPDLILPAGSVIYGGMSALPGGAGSKLNIILKLSQYV